MFTIKSESAVQPYGTILLDLIERIMKSNEQIVFSFDNANWNREQISIKLDEYLEESEFRKYIQECDEKIEQYTERLKELTGGTFELSEVDYSDLD